MGAPLIRTSTPGIYRRGPEGRYVVVYKVDGRQRRETVRTMRDARAHKRQREAARDAGTLVAQSKVTLGQHARQWVERHHGGSRGFRESTRRDYRRDLSATSSPTWASTG